MGAVITPMQAAKDASPILALPAAPASPPSASAPPSHFSLHGLRAFANVPANRDFGIAVLAGMVAIYDTTMLAREGVVENAFYVRESQRPPCFMDWTTWLQREWEERGRQHGPASPLTTGREVVQAIRWPYPDQWSVRLESGYVDGPYHAWAFGRDIVGKVTGILFPQPDAAPGEGQ